MEPKKTQNIEGILVDWRDSLAIKGWVYNQNYNNIERVFAAWLQITSPGSNNPSSIELVSWQTYRPMEQEILKIHSYLQLHFYKNIEWRKIGCINKWCWENWINTHRNIKVDLYFMPH